MSISRKRLGCFWLLLALFFARGILQADELQWAKRSLRPPIKAPEEIDTSISLEILSASEGLFQPRLQYYFRDDTAFYVEAAIGSHFFSALGFAEEYNGLPYSRLQFGFGLGLNNLIYSLNPKITKDERRWGSGFILGLGLRFLVTSFEGGITNTVLSSGLKAILGFQLQAYSFSLSFFLSYSLLVHVGTRAAIATDIPSLQDRGVLAQSLPTIPAVNATYGASLSPSANFTFSQTIGIRLSYSF